ncbi:hypothetical protein GCM10010983_40680 [Caulobacter rhizosphaerae]|nr:hypothetical protein GCM10010983_40680 [Caulobacter rhizosphaerae]
MKSRGFARDRPSISPFPPPRGEGGPGSARVGWGAAESASKPTRHPAPIPHPTRYAGHPPHKGEGSAILETHWPWIFAPEGVLNLAHCPPKKTATARNAVAAEFT